MSETDDHSHLVCPLCGCPELGGCDHWIALIDWTFEFIDDASPLNDQASDFVEQLGSGKLQDAWFELFQGSKLGIVQQALLLAGAREQTGSSYFPPGGLSAESAFFAANPEKTIRNTIRMCQSARNGDPGSACKRDPTFSPVAGPRRRSFQVAQPVRASGQPGVTLWS